MRLCNIQLNMKRLLALLAIVVLLVGSIPMVHATETSGQCGDNLTWELTEDTLVISGSGPMWDFQEQTMAPWYAYRNEITRVIFPDQLTGIGNLAFYDCGQLTVAKIPDAVNRIGSYAFAMCERLSLLDLGNGVATIEKAAFRECKGLRSVRLPNSLMTLGFQAFYRCEGLTSICVPESVTQMEETVFGYCVNLIRAEIYASISRLPEWTFYGCEALTDVHLPEYVTGCDEYAFYDCAALNNVEYDGDYADQINQDIMRDLESSGHSDVVSQNKNDSTSIHTKFEDQEGDLVVSTTTTQQSENIIVSSEETVVYPEDNLENSYSSVIMTVTLENPEGWEEVKTLILQALSDVDEVHVNIFLKNGNSLPDGALNDLAGKKVTISVTTSSGSTWQVDCSQLAVGKADASTDLSYERLPATQTQKDALGGADAYQVKFNTTTDAQAEILIRLPVEHGGENAFLYQMSGGKPNRLQASIVDSDGYAHFYVANVDKNTQYLIGIDVPGEDTSNIIVPKKEEKKFDITDTLAPMDYVITGRKSSWGMEIGQVTWIMIGVLGSSVAVIGVALYLMNKRKLRKGYVVDLDEYEIN